MTELQYGLFGLGATAIVGVLAYNKWQEYKHRKVAEQVLKARHADVLLDPSEAAGAAGNPDGEPFSARDDTAPDAARAAFAAAAPAPAEMPAERLEPVLRLDPRLDAQEPATAAMLADDDAGYAAAAEPAWRADPVEPPAPDYEMPSVETVAEAFVEPPRPTPVVQPAPVAAPVAGVSAPLPEHREAPRESREAKDSRDSAPPAHLLSPAVDFIAAFEAVEPAPAYQILEAQGAALARVRKPIHWIGYNERSREWETIIDDGDSEYRRIRIALQLVDRSGPASDADLSVFSIAMQDLSDELMAVADLPPRQPALNAALELDQFCAGVDIQIGINVVAQGQSFAGTKLRALAEAAGLALDGEGRFVRCDDEGNVLYLLTNQEAAGFSAETMKSMHTHALTFLLDVPRVAHGERVFNQMVDLARRFAEALHGALVDDNRRPLSEGALEPIRRQVGQYQAAMAARQIPAGGPLALRLFA